MNQQTEKRIKQRLQTLPNKPGVYFMRDEYGNIIYIGKAKNLKNRVSSYFVHTHKPIKVSNMVAHVFSFDYIIVNTEREALNLESNLIKRHKPFYNVLLKDGKQHAFLRLDVKKEFPNLTVVRKVKQDGAKYFGPYFAGVSVWNVLQIITDAFLLYDEQLGKELHKPYQREALNFFLGKKKAGFESKLSKEAYLQEVARVLDFLNGDTKYAQTVLTQKMEQNAKLENFERAIELRESLKLLEKLNKQVVTELSQKVDIDVFGYATNGLYSVVSVLTIRAGKLLGASNHFMLDSSLSDDETLTKFIMQYYPQNGTVPKEIICSFALDDQLLQMLEEHKQARVFGVVPQRGIKVKLLQMANANASDYLQKNIAKNKLHWVKTIGAMEKLQQDLHLSQLPVRIECYDISNMQGKHIVASMVVFVNGEPDKSQYRKFKIQTVVGKNNDFESMKEVLTRRMKELQGKDDSFGRMPNLIVIDGGKGQLGYAVDVLQKLNIVTDIVSLAKQQEEVFVPHQSESVYLPRDHAGLHLLQQARDEAHRFAITFHRSLRAKQNIKSELTDIQGVGAKTALLLMKHFKSISKIKQATVLELSQVKGVSKPVAERVVAYFAAQSK